MIMNVTKLLPIDKADIFGQQACHFCHTHFSNQKTKPRPCKTCKHKRLFCENCLVPEEEYNFGDVIRDVCIGCKMRDIRYRRLSVVKNYYNERMAQEAVNLSFMIYTQSIFDNGYDTYLIKKIPKRRNSV
jgi:hypothetical protein